MTQEALRLLYALRGVPRSCDFCLKSKPLHELEPEEGGLWVCHECLKRWENEDLSHER